jgi:hypothetical protein
VFVRFYWFWAFLAAGCSHFRVPERAPLSFEEFTFDQSLRQKVWGVSRGKLDFRYKNGGVIAGMGVIECAFSQKASLTVRDILGRDVLNARLEGTHSTIRVLSEQKLYEDNTAGLNFLLKEAGIPITFWELLKLSYGVVPANWELEKNTWSWENRNYQMLFLRMGGQGRIILDQSRRAIVRVETDEGWELNADDFETVWIGKEKIAFAMRVEIKRKDRFLRMDWDEVPVALSGEPQKGSGGF